MNKPEPKYELLVTRTITSCRECPHRRPALGMAGYCYGFWHEIQNKELPPSSQDTIPEWCPKLTPEAKKKAEVEAAYRYAAELHKEREELRRKLVLLEDEIAEMEKKP